jgi:hypothetical protein
MIQQINSLAETLTPFLFIVDFEMQNPLLFPMDELPPDIRSTTPSYRSPETFVRINRKKLLQVSSVISGQLPFQTWRDYFFHAAGRLCQRCSKGGNTADNQGIRRQSKRILHRNYGIF